MSRPSDWGEVFGIDDPTPGDPFEARRVASSWSLLAGDAAYAETKVRQLMIDDAIDGWIGEAGKAFRSQSTDLPDQLHKCADSYRLASEALSWWAGRLTTHQGDADSALVKGRAAKADLEAAQAHLATMQGSLESESSLSLLSAVPELHPPSREQVQAAQDRLHAAQAAQAQASAAVSAAQSRLDALKQLALDAGRLREQDGKIAASRVHEAADAGIQPRHWWQKATDWIADHWDVIIEIARVAVAALSVVALILGGPLVWLVVGLSVLLLADALSKWREGKASLWDVVLSAVGCIPGARGFTSISGLSAAFRTGGMLGAGAHVLCAGREAVVGLTSSVRSIGARPWTIAMGLGHGEAGTFRLAWELGGARVYAAGTSSDLLDDASRIETHLGRLDHSPANDAMLARIRGAATDGRPLTEAEQNFMTHELTEAGLMDRGMGYPQAHELAGQTHPTFGNYDPEVIKQFPELFNQNWRNYWGIE